MLADAWQAWLQEKPIKGAQRPTEGKPIWLASTKQAVTKMSFYILGQVSGCSRWLADSFMQVC